MANIYTNEVYAFGPADALTNLIGDRTGRAGEVSDWVDAASRTPLRQTFPDLKDYVEIGFTASAKELDGLLPGLSERHQDVVVTHSAVDLANGIAYAQVLSGGFVIGECVLDQDAVQSAVDEQSVFDDLNDAIDAYEKDAIRALAREPAC